MSMLTLAQASSGGGGGAGAIIFILIELAIAVLMIASYWKLFSQAGEPGWASIIPIYNGVVMLKIAGKPIWWLVLFFIPLVNFIVAIMVMIEFAKAYGKGAGFGIGLTFLPFIFAPMLAFGDAQYVGSTTDF